MSDSETQDLIIRKLKESNKFYGAYPNYFNSQQHVKGTGLMAKDGEGDFARKIAKEVLDLELELLL